MLKYVCCCILLLGKKQANAYFRLYFKQWSSVGTDTGNYTALLMSQEPLEYIC